MDPDTTDPTDPYRPDATTDERTDHVIGTLLSDEDPVRRYRTIQALQDGRLRDVSAISLRQLRDQHGSTEAAAAAVGISRQAANELLGKAGAPGAREDRLVRDTPAYAYGQYLAAVGAIAEFLPHGPGREKAILHWHDLMAKASQTVAMIPILAETAQRWLKTIRTAKHRPNLAAKYAAILDDYGAKIAEWVMARSTARLTVAEQWDMYIGYHSQRVQWRQESE
jgi:hypothetical protein